MKDIVKGYLAAFISAATYGMIPLFMIPIKQEGFSVDASLFYRFIVTSICLAVYFGYKRESLRISFRELVIFMVLGILYSLSAEFLFASYDLLTLGIASTIFFMYPLIVAIVLGIFFKERITIPTIIALIVVLIGVFLLSVKDMNNFTINFFGALVSLLGALAYALYMVIVNKSKIAASSVKVSFYSTLFSATYFLIKLYITGNTLPIPSISMGCFLTAFGIVTTLLSLLTLIYAIRMIGSTPTAIIGVVEPVVAIAISIWIFKQEELTINLLIGVVLIVTAVTFDVLQHTKKTQ